MVGGTNLRNIIHFFGPQLYFHIASGTVIIKRDMQRLIIILTVITDVIPIVRLCFSAEQWRCTFLHSSGRLCGKSSFFQKSRKYIGDLIKITKLFFSDILTIFQMTSGHGDNDPVGNKIAETA